jgi:hypothetical protein
MKEIKTSKGILKYRMPNLLEAYDLLEESGVNDKVSNLKLKRNIIKAMGELVDCSEIECQPSYNDLLNDIDEMAKPLSDIADEVILKAFGAFKKKN